MTDKYIQSLSVAQGDRLKVSDQKAEGLRLRVGGSGRKVFSYEGRGPGGRIRTVTIGPYPDVSLKEARDEAEALRRRLRQGEDPTAEKAVTRAPKAPEPTLRGILEEYQAYAGPTRSTWRSSERSKVSEAQSRIGVVFHNLLDEPLPSLTSADLAASMRGYRPRAKGKTTANGQVSRARAYLSSVLNWAANRGSFQKHGAGRPTRVDAPSISETHDPASTDPTILGRRDRVLVQDELAALLPLLRFPSLSNSRRAAKRADDVRPAAIRFVLLTAARLGEVTAMRWCDLNRSTGLWHKSKIKSTRGGAREQYLPLPDAAWELLETLPGWRSGGPDDLVFPNGKGGKLGNWARATRAIQHASGVKG